MCLHLDSLRLRAVLPEAQEDHLAQLFLDVANKLGHDSTWANHWRGRCDLIVRDGLYDSIACNLESLLD